MVHAIPEIDISPLYGPASAAREAVDKAIMAAASDSGFMTVKGLPDDILSRDLRRQLLAVFGLSAKEKHDLGRWNEDPSLPNIYRGWFPLRPGNETYKEGTDMGPDVAHDTHVVDPGDPLTEATPMPAEERLPGWRAAVKRYYLGMERAGSVIMASLARGLGLPETFFEPYFKGGISSMRLARYPARTPDTFPADPSNMWLDIDGERWLLVNRAHCDSGFVTFVAQDGVAGLQARHHDGSWLTVPPTEGAMAVNFGQLLQRWTGGRIRATDHRVIGRPGVERFSLPFFYEPHQDAIITPMPGLDAPGFEPFAYGNHLWDITTKFIEQRGIAHLRQPKPLKLAG